MMLDERRRYTKPFNGPVEIGLRALAILDSAYPEAYSLQRLVVLDYLIVHSDDVVGGPPGLHPQTPHRGGELLVRRKTLQDGLTLLASRNLIERRYEKSGLRFAATDLSFSFLSQLRADYTSELRDRAEWLLEMFGSKTDVEIEQLAQENIENWGAEFAMESVLWEEEAL